jgi:hypothetical protein
MLVCAALSQIAASAQAASPEIDFVYPEAPGVIFTNAEGHADGPLYKYMASVFEGAQVPFHATQYPLARLLDALKTQSNAFSVLVYFPFLDECCIRSKEPNFVGDIAAYSMGELPPVTKREDFVGHSVITRLGNTFGSLTPFLDDPKNHIAHDVAPEYDIGFRMLKLRRADYFVSFSINAIAYLAEHPMGDIHCSVFDHTLLYFVLSKSYPDAEKMLARLEASAKGIEKAKSTGIGCK